MKAHLTCCAVGLLVFAGVEDARAVTLPHTEQGNVLLRSIDVISIPGFDTYVGHVGILGGWQGNNAESPDDYFIFDTQRQGMKKTSLLEVVQNGGVFPDSTVMERTFAGFTQINTLVVMEATDYTDGFTVTQQAGGVSAIVRRLIKEKARAVVGTPLTVELFSGFVKDPANLTFRCDGFVEWINELAGVQGGQGLWPNDLESTFNITTPADYAQNLTTIVAELGQGPQTTQVNTQYPGDETVTLTGQSFDGVFGSGVQKVQAGFIQSGNFIGLAQNTDQVDGTKNFSLSFRMADIPSEISEGKLVAYDRAGNNTQVSFPIADPYFLVENEKLIFSGLARKTRENWGSRSLTIGLLGGDRGA